MSFTIKPISGIFVKDLDTFSKMDPYVKLTIGNKKYRSRTHKHGGKTPTWNDTFQVITGPNLLMKIQAWDEDIIKDDFLGEGYYNLGQLMNLPGNTQNQYVDLIKHGKSCGRVLLSMKFNPPPQTQSFGSYQYQQPYNIQAQMPLQNYNYQNQPWINQSQSLNKGPNKNWGVNPYQDQSKGWNKMNQNQENIFPANQNQNTFWEQKNKKY